MSDRLGAVAILLGAFVLQGAVLSATGRWHAVEVPDTVLYREFSFASLESFVSQTRTPGYPTLLAAVRMLGGTEHAIPFVQTLLFWGATATFFVGLTSLSCPRCPATFIAASLLASDIVIRYVPTIATDTPAAAAGVATVGCLMRWHGQPRRPVLWGAALMVCMTSAWLLRPASLFLIVFVPLASVGLWMRSTDRSRTIGQAVKHLLLVGAMCGLPVLAWSGLRWAVIGKLAVVSFGGYNLIGVTGQFLNEKTVSSLDENLQPLAREALKRRAGIPASELPLEELDPLNYMRMEAQYDITIWRVFEPAAAAFDDDPPAINSALKDLGVALGRQNSASYALWLLKASRQALRKLVGDVVTKPLGAVLVCLTVLTAVLRLMHLWWTGAQVTISGPMVETTALLLVLSALYAATLLTLTILVCPPLARMTDAAGVLLFPLVTSTWLTLLGSTDAGERTAGDAL